MKDLVIGTLINGNNNRVILLFPPNWSACVNGPHLALPIIAGSLKKYNYEVETWDLSEDFYRLLGKRPSNEILLEATSKNDFQQLDELYFKWEDSFLEIAKEYNNRLGLLSGFNENQKIHDLSQIIKIINQGTVYSNYFKNVIIPRLDLYKPSFIGVTISSQYQLLPTIELAVLIKKNFPQIKIVLGGNYVTRIKNTKSFHELSALFDKVILYQGELEIIKFLKETLDEKIVLPSDNQKIEPELWSTPNYEGLPIGNYPGINCVSFVSTRGCYYNKCPFCAIPKGWSESGFAGSMSTELLVEKLEIIIQHNHINRIKFVDEAFLATRVKKINELFIMKNIKVFWEAYARVEKIWEDDAILEIAYKSGCRKLYFGLEISPDANRNPLGKNDNGNILIIMEKCKRIGILVHLFCMVGHPYTTKDDAYRTTKFLIDNQELIDTADLVGFRLDRGTKVKGVIPNDRSNYDFTLSLRYEPVSNNVLSMHEVMRLEYECQEKLWEFVPRLLHPLYRIAQRWEGEESSNLIDKQMEVLFT